jgi:hypothetical protein
MLCMYPDDVTLGEPLGSDVAWPALTHLQVTPWASLLLHGCAFPRLSRLVAHVPEGRRSGDVLDEWLRPAVTSLASKARDHVAVVVDHLFVHEPEDWRVLAAAAAVPRLRHLTLCGVTAAPSGGWARLPASLESVELSGSLAAFGYAEPLAALTGLTQLFLAVSPCGLTEDAAAAGAAPPPPLQPAGRASEGDEPPLGPECAGLARAARALAGLPRLAHLRLTVTYGSATWASPAVAASLARCPALRLLEIGRPGDPLWRHELGLAHGAGPRVPRPSPAWRPFAEALRAGGFGGVVRPAPASRRYPTEFDLEI